MPITSVDLKDLADRLASDDADEASLRAACSRAYYAGFHALLPFVSQLPRSEVCRPEVTHVTHKEMSDRLREWKTEGVHPGLADKTVIKANLRRAIDAARGLREKADYRIEDFIRLGEARSQVERARLILRTMDQIDLVVETASTPLKSEQEQP